MLRSGSVFEGCRIADAAPDDVRRIAGEIHHGRRFHAAGAAVDDDIQFMLQGVANVPGVGHRPFLVREKQGDAHDGFAQNSQQGLNDAVAGYAQSDGLTFGVYEAFGRFLGGREDERVGAGCGVLEQAEGAVVHPGVDRQFLEIPADQREVVILVGIADTPDAVQGGFVSQVAAQGVAGIGGVGDDAALADDFYGAGDEAWLGIVRVDVEELAQGGGSEGGGNSRG